MKKALLLSLAPFALSGCLMTMPEYVDNQCAHLGMANDPQCKLVVYSQLQEHRRQRSRSRDAMMARQQASMDNMMARMQVSSDNMMARMQANQTSLSQHMQSLHNANALY